MDTIVLASKNKHKAGEISKILGEKFKVVTMNDMGINIDIVENGKSFRENAMIKVNAIKEFFPKNTIIMGDDSGLCVDALDGAPGIYSARYAGEGAKDETNNKKLLKMLKNIPKDKRTARFVCAIALHIPEEKTITVNGEILGTIGYEVQGENGFGYDSLFIYNKKNKTLAEISEVEKNEISHRAIAIKRAKKILESFK